MTAGIEIWTGLAPSDKVARLHQLQGQVGNESGTSQALGRSLWLVPHARDVREVLARLGHNNGVTLAPQVLTWRSLAQLVLTRAGEPVTEVTRGHQRVLMRTLLRQLRAAGELRHFGPLAGSIGLLDQLLAWIDELKRSGIEPDELRVPSNRERGREHDLALIYKRYQHTLEEHSWFDAEGLTWRACDLLSGPSGQDLLAVDLVLIEGFDDFDETELELVETLARRATRTVVTLPLAEDGRAELFARTHRVIDRLRSRLRGQLPLRVVPQPDTTASLSRRPAGLQRVTRALFGNSRLSGRTSDAAGLEIVATAGQRAEVEWVALRVKQLLMQGSAPEEVIVAIRDLEEYRDLWRSVAQSTGLPLFVDSRPRLSDSPLVRDLLMWLAVEVSDWEYDRLRSALRLPRTASPDPTVASDAKSLNGSPLTVSALLHCLRLLQLPVGRSQIVRRLGDSAGNSEGGAGLVVPSSVSGLVGQIDEWLAPLRSAAPLRNWAERLRAVATLVGTLRQPGLTSTDLADWNSALRLIDEAAAIEGVATAESRRLTLGEFVAEWTDMLRQERSGQHPPDWGRVRVLTPEATRTLRVKHLIVMGLGEAAFPRRRGENCLGITVSPGGGGGEASRSESLFAGEDRVAEEMLLFHRLVSAADESLVLTYPAVSPSGGPLAPSSYVEAVRDLFIPQECLEQQEDHLSPLPLPGRVSGTTALRCHAVAQALAGEGGLFQAAATIPRLRPALTGVLRAARLNVARFHTPGFTSAEGMLAEPLNQAELARRYNTTRQYSATQLEAYANCPFRFGVSELLGAEPLDGLEYATDHGERGRLLHQLLARLHAGPLPPREGEESEGARVARRFLELLEEESQTRQRAADPFLRVIGELEWAQLREWGTEYGLQWDAWRTNLGKDWEEPPQPVHFEVAFGASRSLPEGSTDSPTAPEVLRGPAGEVRLTGRIDRIDVGRQGGRPVYLVVDYKSGKKQSLKRKDISTGLNLQLPIYALAARRLAGMPPDVEPVQAIFWYLRGGGSTPGLKGPGKSRSSSVPLLQEADWNAIASQLNQTVPHLVARLRGAEFPVHNRDAHCQTYCAYNTICRVAQVRSVTEHLHKVWNLPDELSASQAGEATPAGLQPSSS
jgi:ATP-dependent helicase/DNAse subunit B